MAPRSNGVPRRGFQALLLVSVLALVALTPGTVEAQGAAPNISLSAAGGTIGVTWTGTSSANRHRVQWKSGSESYDSSRQKESTSSRGTFINELTGGVEYTVRVQARFGSTWGDWSAEKSARVLHAQLGKVPNLRVSGVAGNMNWSWGAVTNAAQYRFQWKAPGEDWSSSRQRDYGSSTTSVNDRRSNVFTPGLTYTFRVRALRDHVALQSEWSDEFRFLVGAQTPQQVGSPTVTARPGALEVSWPAGTDVTSYLLQWKSGDQSYDESRQITVPGTDTSATIENLAAGTEYSVQVIATRQHASANAPPSTERMGTPASGLAIGGTSAPEGEELSFTVTLDPPNVREVTVMYADAGTGSATADTDYTLEAGTLTFAPGETSKTIAVTVMDDMEIELDETVMLTLSNPTGSATIATGTATGTIENDDSRITVPGQPSYTINGHTVTVDTVGTDIPDGIEFELPLDLDGPVTLTLGPVTSNPPDPGENEFSEFRLGEVETDRTRVDFTVTPVPAGGLLEVCFPVTAGLLAEAGGSEQIRLLHYDGMNWREAGSQLPVKGNLVCASGVTAFSPFAVGYVVPSALTEQEVEDVAMVLAGVARTLASDAVDVIGGRFDASSAGGGQMKLAGHALRLTGGLPSSEYAMASTDTLRRAVTALDGEPGHARVGGGWRSDPMGEASWRGAEVRELSAKDLLTGSSFELPLNASGAEGGAGGPVPWTLWGRGAASGFDGTPESGFSMDGTLYSGYLGMDYRPRPSVLAGFAMSYSQGTVDYERTGGTRAEIDVELTSVLPYVHWRPRSGLGLWGLLGMGLGEMEFTRKGTDGAADRTQETDLTSYLGAVGGRQELRSWRGIDLAVKADAFTSTIRSEARDEENVPEVRGRADRVRMLMEGSREWASGPGFRFVPHAELGGRWDGGTAEGGFGIELGGGLAYTDTSLGLSVEAQGRYLVAHTEGSFDEWGASVNMSLDPGVAGRGVSLTVAPVWGQGGSGSERLWSGESEVLAQLDGTSGERSSGWTPQHLDVALEYGLPLSRDRGMVTPYGGMTLGGSDASRYRLGSRVALGSSLNLSVEGARTEQAGESASHGVTARLGIRW